MSNQTIVTCLYDLSSRGARGARPLGHYQAHAGLTLLQPLPLVAFVDPHLAGWVTARRSQFDPQHQTLIVPRPLEALAMADRAASFEQLPCIDNGQPGKDDGWHLVVNLSKIGLLAEVAAADPFGTGRFAWMDVGIGHVARRPASFPAPCDRPTLLQMMPVFREEVDWDFHRLERGRIAAGFVRGGADELVSLGRLFAQELDRAVDGGRLPTDQTVLSALSALHPDLFDYTFGDYPSSLANWDLVRGDEPSVLANVEHCVRFERWHDARQRCRLLRSSLEAGTARLHRDLEDRLVDAEKVVAAHLDAPEPSGAVRVRSADTATSPAEPATRTARQTVALCMIVKDEARVVGRCLDSVLGVIDTWVIVDTGSSDDTPAVVAELLGAIPGALHRRPWRDFGSNRTELLALARGSADYLLLLDADMTLNVRGALPLLTADGYLLAHEGPLRYSVPRLVRGDRQWHFVGATHEYLSSEEPFTLERLDRWSVTHHADGGSRADKLARDLELLERQYHETPDDPRTVFYLAQTCRDMGDRARAAELYRRRVSLGGWHEEVFYAALQLGMLTADADWPAGSSLLVDTWERRPSRSEPLYEIAVRARSVGDFATANWATAIGVDIPMPRDILFVHRWVYEWGMRFERSIAAAHVGELDEALALTDELLARDGVPREVKAALEGNRRWLRDHGADPKGACRKTRHAELRDLCPRADIAPLPTAPLRFGWAATNPSIASSEDALSAVLRAVNYELDGSGHLVHAPDGTVRTENVLLCLGDDLSLVDYRMLAEPGDVPRYQTGVLGFEDCRLFRWHDDWWAVATCRDLEPQGICRMVLLRVDGERWHLEAVLAGPDATRHEKNWMPFVVDERLHFVYTCRPFVVYRWEEEARQLREIRRVPTDCRFAGLRGSSQGLRIDDGYLFVTHETRVVGNARPDYLHRFVTLDATLTPSGISPAFAFVHDGVEFCAGLARRGDDLLLSFGVEDRCAAVAIVPLDEVIDVIDPVSDRARWL
ncbi:MAG: WlaTC/HtrL family glycosyltransferase [Actinomycetota bacterium]|nr:WlaTC/HtrL family glycosyltransferase [Actinomycetota bacterium]